MECAIVQHHWANGSMSIFTNNKIVIKNQSKPWISSKIALALYDSLDWTIDYGAIRVEKYTKLLKYVNEYLILITLALFDNASWLVWNSRVHIADRPLDRVGRGCSFWENVPFGLHFLFDLLLRVSLLDNHGVTYSVLPDVLGRHQLRVPVVNNLVNDFINEHKVFPNGFFIENSAVIPKYFHHSINNVHHETWGNVVLCGGYEVDSELLREEIIEALNILQNSKIKRGLTNEGGGSPSHRFTFL